MRRLAHCAIRVVLTLLVSSPLTSTAQSEGLPPEVPTFSGPRLRLGFGFEWAPVSRLSHPFGNEPVIGAEVHLRLGLQASRHFAVYYQGSAAAANTVRLCLGFCTGSQNNYWLFVHESSVVAEATLWNRLQVALGPALFVMGPSWISPTPGGEGGLGWGGVARIGVVPKPGLSSARRKGVSLALQGQTAFFEHGSLLSLGIAVGYDLF